MNLKNTFFFLFISFSINLIYAQKDGYWDKERATKREIVVSAGDRIVIKTEELPSGTTELIFRITLLDGNQQMANSLVSLLKSIPDPTGISQGSAGAIFLLSKISGTDKCKYAIFSNEGLASDYQKKGTTTKACYEQKEAIAQDVKRLSIDKSSCILPNADAIWFGFESKNWILNQKIVLEVVPWVNNKLSSGWNLSNRKMILNQCKSLDIAKKISISDDFCVCILEKIQKEYKYQEWQKLLTIEKSKNFNDFGNACLQDIGSSDKLYADLRAQISTLMQGNKFRDAIAKIELLGALGKATATDFNTLGYAYLMTKQYSKAIKSLKSGEKLDDSELLIQMNLAHAYLFDNDYKAAKTIYKKYQFQNVTDSLSWTDKVKQDFETFKQSGFSSDDYDRVLKLLED